ncbi:hypothetical protein BJ912DRAFT_1131504 [Pholiota molesta]|nr:hypothetical protein BJ912DRAFT_1131504 [Pholiota molesta]
MDREADNVARSASRPRYLLLPVKLPDGQFEIQRRAIEGHGVTKPTLQTMCKEYDLDHSGKVDDLRKTLIAYSQDKELWEQLKPNTVRSRLGSHTGAPALKKKPGPSKKSALRLEALKSGLPVSSSTPQALSATAPAPTALPVTAPARCWNQEQHERDLEWAASVRQMFPYRDEETRMQLAARRQQLQAETPIGVDIKKTLDAANKALQELLMHKSTVAMPSIGSTGPAPMSAAYLASSSPSSPAPDTNAPVLGNHTPLSTPPAALQSRSITLADGFVLSFTESDVPNPPVPSFSRNLEHLNQMWDYDPAYWKGNSYIVIKGHPIPIIYWRAIYTSKGGKKWKARQWESLKAKVFNFRVLVQAMRPSIQEFWQRFSDSEGKRKTCTAILKDLRDIRTAKNDERAQCAREEYGAQFDELFRYQHRGVLTPLTKSCDIAKRYCQLKGIAFEDFDEDED